MATVVLTPEAAREIADLPTPIVARLEQWPEVSGVKSLRGNLAGHYRLRTGDYRMQFRIEQHRTTIRRERTRKGKKVVEEQVVVETRVVVEKAGHRDGFYEE